MRNELITTQLPNVPFHYFPKPYLKHKFDFQVIANSFPPLELSTRPVYAICAYVFPQNRYFRYYYNKKIATYTLK